MSTDWTWDEMIEEFRALGGIADNVRMGTGPLGRGLFAIDAERPAQIHVPTNLLFDAENITFENDMLRVKEKSKDRAREEKFFENFENIFSWGGGGRVECEEKNNLFAGVPEPIAQLISKRFVKTNLFNKAGPDSARNRFLTSRRLRVKDGRNVLMPVLELVNHDVSGQPFTFDAGLGVKGVFSSEILARYNITDPFGAFFTWGFPSNSFHAYSLPLAIKLGGRQLLIKRDLKEKEALGRVMAPKISTKGRNIILSHLMIGSAKNPRLAKGTFYRLMRDMEVPNVEEVFDRIYSTNTTRFLNLLLELEKFEGPSIAALRKMALLQLEAISHCMGVRDP